MEKADEIFYPIQYIFVFKTVNFLLMIKSCLILSTQVIKKEKKNLYQSINNSVLKTGNNWLTY